VGPFILGLVYAAVGLYGTFWATALAALSFVGVAYLMIQE
jgi:hypothetical protein